MIINYYEICNSIWHSYYVFLGISRLNAIEFSVIKDLWVAKFYTQVYLRQTILFKKIYWLRMGPLKQICYAIKSLHFFSRMPDKNLKEVVSQIGLSYEYGQDRVIVNQFAYTLTNKFESIFLFILLFWNISHTFKIMRALKVSITKKLE